MKISIEKAQIVCDAIPVAPNAWVLEVAQEFQGQGDSLRSMVTRHKNVSVHTYHS